MPLDVRDYDGIDRLGAAIFDQWPDWTVWVGAVIVVGSGLVIAWRERRLGLQKQRIQSV